MTTGIILCVFLLAVFGHSEAQGSCAGGSPIFIKDTMNVTVNIRESVEFECLLDPALDPNFFFANWEFSSSTNFGSPLQITSFNKVALGYVINDSRLMVPDVQRSHVGFYRCSINTQCVNTKHNNIASLIITGSPVISSTTPDPKYQIETLSDLIVIHRITGSPLSIQVFHIANGITRQISSETEPRFSVMLDIFELTITLRDVMRSDGGVYQIVATNNDGTDRENITLIPNGPDPPVLSVDPMIVANFPSPVQVRCTINQGATVESETIEWRNPQGIVVSTTPGLPVYTEILQDGSARLNIGSLDVSLTGAYKCFATNARGNDTETTQIFGPPPPPVDKPTIMKIVSGDVIVSWVRPSSRGVADYIDLYLITIYQGTTDTQFDEKRVDVFSNHTEVNHTITNLPAGEYTVTLTSSVNGVSGDETQRSNFVIDPPSTFPVVIASVVASVAVGVVIFIAIVILCGVYCYCSYKARRNQINSQQRTWNSEEKMTHLPPPVQNSYTALALHDNPELPPSPMSPMTSSIGIDPKWEFPRENIQLLDPLAEGQFTVLYKGSATGLIEKPCTVAVKTLREDATEDDLKAFVYEMDVLSSIEEHPNIVSLVRVCSVGRPLYMVMEYMCHGDLLGFLRACRGHQGMYTVSPGTRYQPPTLQLCSRDLLNMATKIANGMHYLADRKIVHRALCTKNILVGSGMDVKIYNVGSFDAVLENNREGLVKWMAPETLFDGTNTTYSDVWSFGVTLWELVTLGGTPYGDILPEDIYTQLQSGMRMPCPTHCAQEVYNIMNACWEKNPTDRPHFSIIHDNLDELVMSKLNYLDLRSYDGDDYSQFGDDGPTLATVL